MEKRVIAGSLLILVFLIGLSQYISALSLGAEYESSELMGLEKYILALGVVSLFLGVFALLGAYFALSKKSWAGALICAILGIFSLGGIIVGPILSLVATILIAMSKAEFVQETPPQEFSADYGGTLPGALPPQ
jgi:hypothetical protein